MRGIAILLALLAAPALAQPPGCRDGVPVSELVTDYACKDGTRAMVSDGTPANWWDGQRWRAPEPVWRGDTLAGVPGALMWRAEPDRLAAYRRDGGLVGALAWRGVAAGSAFVFDWQGLPCSITAGARTQKLACTVDHPLGRRTLRVHVTGDVSIASDGGALLGGLWRLEPLVVIGANGIEYSIVSHWDLDRGELAVSVDDWHLPPAAFPYVIDPDTGVQYPATCTSASGVGSVAWTSASNAQTSNDTRASASLPLNAQSNWLKCTGFGFSNPPLSSDKVIKGIQAEAEVQRGGAGATMTIADIRGVKADGSISTTNGASGTSCTGEWTASDAWRICGGSSSLWGEAWTPADITDVDFGIALSAKNTGSTTRNALVDAVRMTVYYTPPSGRVFVTGWDSQSAEDGTVVTAGGTPTYVGGAARTGASGLHLAATASAASAWGKALDADLSDRVYGRFYWATTPTIPAGQSVVVAYAKEDTNVGCYLKLSKSADGCFSYQTLYHGAGTGDLDFGTFAATTDPSASCVTSLAGHAVMLGQRITGQTAACPLAIDGREAQSFAIALVSDCSGGACDLAGFYIGSPATGAVKDYAAFPAYTLDVDDLVIDNLNAPGVGYVKPIYPSGAGATNAWGDGTGCTGFQCVDDWKTTVADACSTSGAYPAGGDTRQKNSNTGIDFFAMDDLSPALSSSDAVAAVRALTACCGTSSSDNIRLRWRSGATEYAEADQVVAGGGAAIPFSATQATDIATGNPAWTESAVNALQVGFERYSAGASNARCSALMAYVDVTTPTAQPDRNLQDWNGAGGIPDGKITVVTGCDSITAGTDSSFCVSTVGSACTAACTSDADCGGGVCQATGTCVTPCEVTADCACGGSPICTAATKWVNQFSLKAPQVDNLINCGRNAMPSQWWNNVVDDIIANPYSHAVTCKLVRGAWGHCSSTTTQDCAVDSDCPPAQTCVPYAADYVIDMCGGNEFIGYGPADCTAGVYGIDIWSDRWGMPACPRAVATPTPGAWQVARRTCTTNTDCTGDPNYGAGSLCQGSCAGHTDPVWSCGSEADCGECGNDVTRRCTHIGQCIDSNGILLSDWCNSDADCATGTCSTWESRFGSFDDPYGTCGLCTMRACNTSAGNKFCTPTCNAVTCSTDADCAPAGVLGGICDSGTHRCKACASGGLSAYPIDTSASTQILDAKRLGRSLGDLTPDKVASRDAALTATVRAAGARRIESTYARSFLLSQNEAMKNVFQGLAKTKLRNAPLVVDAHYASSFYDNRLLGGVEFLTSDECGSLLLFDCIHNVVGGATVSSQLIAASVNLIYPVCSANSAEVCGACDVACATDAQCSKPVVGTSPTPTPKAGACRTATPAVNVCGCLVDADCAAGCTCEDVQPGAGVDKRCICEAMASCPAGDSSRARKRAASDTTCAAGSCTEERVPPLCTMGKNRCQTIADCLGAARGDVCAADGVLQSCQVNADCTRDGGKYADPVCAPAPVAAGTPTPKDKLCQQPTPTPT